MKATIKKGMLLGLITGLIVTLFDGLYMLAPNIYVPYSYPILLITFNTILWITFGGLSGLFMRVFARNREDLKEKENFYWVFFFLLPFVLIYGVLGRLFISYFSTTIKTASPVFDHHISFIWALLIILFLIVYKREVTLNKSYAVLFIPEIVTFIALFTFCSNISKIGNFFGFSNYLYLHFGQSFFQDIQLSYKTYVMIYRISLYIMGVVLILGCYLFTVSKIKLLIRKQNLVVILLFLMTSLSLAAHFIVSHNRLVSKNYPPNAAPQIQASKKAPSVVLIVLDTVRADRLSIYGPHGITKNLEQIAVDSLVFTNCITSSSWTLPSHASLFTGLFPTEHGSHGNLNAKKRADGFPPPQPLSDKFITLAEIFKNDGYQTAGIASNYIFLQPLFKINKGFQIYDCVRNVGILYQFYPFRPIVHLFCHITNFFPKYTLPYRTTDEINKQAFRFLERYTHSPFFLFINYMDAHDPYRPPSPFDGFFLDTAFPQLYKFKQHFLRHTGKLNRKAWDSYQLSQYDGEIAYLDHHLGKLFSKLKQLGIYDSSLIIITSDHGDLFGEHGQHFHRTPMYEGAVKAPLVIKFPFSRRVGYEKRMITLADLYPTILSICDLPIPDGISGKSFGNGSMPIVSEFYNYGIGEHRILYDGQYKYMAYQHQRKSELYDLKKDPLEKVNLAEKLPEITAAMSKKLNEWIKKHKPKYKDREEIILSQDVLEGLKALGYISDEEPEEFKPPFKGCKSIPNENQ